MERHEILSELAWNCQRSGPALTQEESVRRLKVIDAFRKGNWDAFMKILSTVNALEKKGDSQFWWMILRMVVYEVMVYDERHDVIEFLVREGWPIKLDALLHNAACSIYESSLETIEWLCLLGAGGITAYWDSCISLYGQVATYGLLLEHNVVVSPPRMLLCEEGDLDGNEISQQQQRLQQRQEQPLTFWLDISGDRCRKRRERSLFRIVRDDEYGEVLGLVKLYARNGAPIAVHSSLWEQLPQAESKSRVSEIMAAALQPASLQALCRKAVRQVGAKRLFKQKVTEELGLPERLSIFLCTSSSSKA